MRTLTEVFAPGTPSLPEGLRTLVVSPERELEPGMSVRATFTFRNQGGATATGVRVRFNVPDGLVYLVGTGQLDGLELDDEQGNSPLLSRGGAHIGDVTPGQERTIAIGYSVAGAIENGSTVELQAAVAAFELAPVGSNVVRLIARSKPALENALTNIAIEGRHEVRPGSEATITVRIHNAGESSAHDVVVVAPIPEFSSYIPNSVRVNGRELERDLPGSFDRVHAPVVVKNLPASATATLTYRIRIADPIPNGASIVARARIASQEIAAFALAPASLTVSAAPEFGDEETFCRVEPLHDVEPGARVAVRVRAYNSGSSTAENVAVAITLADGLLPVRGGARVDGRPLRDRKKDVLAYDLGRIEARAARELQTEATVASPAADGDSLAITVTLSWNAAAKGETLQRAFERTVTVRSVPHLSGCRNRVERTSREIVHPSEEIEASISIENEGSAAATDAVLQLHLDPALDDVRVGEKSAKSALDGDSVNLGSIEPYGGRRFTVRARVRSPYPDRSEIRLGASLHTHELGETALGEAVYRVDSHPAFMPDTSLLELATGELLRPNQLADVFVHVRNEGTDVAQNVRMRLYVSPEARLESVDGATRERSTLIFGEIAPGAIAKARLGLRLMRSLAKEYPVTVDGVLTAEAMLPVQLNRLTIVTTAEPNFAVGTFRSEPPEIVDVGEMIEYVLHLRNGGDGPARRVSLTVDALDSLIYVPNSTTVNDVPVRDVGALAPFAGGRGIAFNDVDPGIEATIRWRDVVHNGLAAGEAIVRVAHVRYDGDRLDHILSSELKVRSAPVFANSIPGLPFGLDGMIGPSFAGGPRALGPAENRVLELPPATAIEAESGEIEVFSQFIPVCAGAATEVAETRPEGSDRPTVATLASFTPEELEKALRFLEEARFGGLVSHLFAIRAFVPNHVGGVDASALEAERSSLRESLDRLFIKLRLPHYTIAPRDIEGPAARATLEHFLSALTDGNSGIPQSADEHSFRGEVHAGELVELRARVRDAALGTALPWLALARCMPDALPELGNYRDVLSHALLELVPLDAMAFTEALQRRRYAVLDAALDVVRAKLNASRTR